MENTSYLQLALNKIKELGYSVFTTQEQPTYAFFSNGIGIGHIQKDFAGLYLSTINKQPFSSNSGFIVSTDKQGTKQTFTIEELTTDILNLAFADYPIWLNSYPKAKSKYKVVKHKDLNDFLTNYWNKENLMEL